MSARIVIRSRERRAYLGDQGQWSHSLANARAFSSAFEAESHCHSAQLGDVDIVIYRTNQPAVCIPVHPPKKTGDA